MSEGVRLVYVRERVSKGVRQVCVRERVSESGELE